MKKLLVLLPFIFSCQNDPTFTTKQGTKVFLDDSLQISQEELENSLDCFTNVENPPIDQEKALKMLSNIEIRFSKELYFNGKRYYGLQQAYLVLLEFPGSMENTALWHELVHAYQENVLGVFDYQHTRDEWKNISKYIDCFDGGE
jgi:hypothetical protein